MEGRTIEWHVVIYSVNEETANVVVIKYTKVM
jgi:hypothetical protein